jgi:hypothetical protein
MPGILISRRATLVGFSALAASGSSGCNTPQTTVGPAAAPAAAAISGYRIANISVDTGPLIAQSGNPTAEWAQDALPGALAQAFASHMAPGDPSGETLRVRIDSIYLGGGGPADPDRMKGVATLNGRQTTVMATSTEPDRSGARGTGPSRPSDGTLAGLRLLARPQMAKMTG